MRCKITILLRNIILCVREERVHGGRLDEHLGEELSEEDDGGDVVKVRGPFVALARKMAESA